jgi:5-methylcytosine-specific restriction endonuclease McrA
VKAWSNDRKPPRRGRAAREYQKFLARQQPSKVWRNPLPPLPPPTEYLIEGVDVRSDEFLRTFAWRRLRYKALRMTRGHCECCGASPATGARLNVDHIQPRKRRPDLALDLYNLQVLCHDCNAGKGNWDETDWR